MVKTPQSLQLQTFSAKKSANFVEEQYGAGTTCDITDSPRQIEIRYRCFPDSKKEEIKTPTEVSSCIYQMDVSVPALCEHPDFITKQQPAYEIGCYPKGVEAPPPDA